MPAMIVFLEMWKKMEELQRYFLHAFKPQLVRNHNVRRRDSEERARDASESELKRESYRDVLKSSSMQKKLLIVNKTVQAYMRSIVSDKQLPLMVALLPRSASKCICGGSRCITGAQDWWLQTKICTSLAMVLGIG